MSQDIDEKKIRERALKKPDYTSPIARTGEQQFVCILRNRSGESAGEIDFGARLIDDLCEADKISILDCLIAIYCKYVDETGLRSKIESRIKEDL